jgi:hypothetical protein
MNRAAVPGLTRDLPATLRNAVPNLIRDLPATRHATNEAP